MSKSREEANPDDDLRAMRATLLAALSDPEVDEITYALHGPNDEIAVLELDRDRAEDLIETIDAELGEGRP